MDMYEKKEKERQLQIRVGQAINLAGAEWVDDKAVIFPLVVDKWFVIINETQKRYMDKYFPEKIDIVKHLEEHGHAMTPEFYESLTTAQQAKVQSYKREFNRLKNKELRDKKKDEMHTEISNEGEEELQKQ